jgi:hypothetical protein
VGQVFGRDRPRGFAAHEHERDFFHIGLWLGALKQPYVEDDGGAGAS